MGKCPQMKKVYFLLLLILPFFSNCAINAKKQDNSTPVAQSTENEINMDGINFGSGFQRGINFGNMLEAPNEGEWGVYARDEYFKIVKDLGFDFIRLPVRWPAHTTGFRHKINPSFFKRVDHLIAQALDNDLGLILNIHHFFDLDNNPGANSEKLYAIWKQLSEHYAGLPLNVVFEINNEPHGKLTTETWNEYQNKCIEIIRQTNPTRKILVTAAEWGGPNGVINLVLPKDENLFVSFHCYDPFMFTHQGAEWVDDPNAKKWIGTQWHGTSPELRDLEQPFLMMRSWSEATGIPVILGEFGATDKADMASRARWTAAMREMTESFGFAWSYWEFCSGFGIYDPVKKQIREPLARALTGAEINPAYGKKHGLPKIAIKEQDGFIGPAEFIINVPIICDSWTGMSRLYKENGNVIIELNGPDRVPDWAQVFIPLLEVKDTGAGFSFNYAELTFRNINRSITDFCINIENTFSYGTKNYKETAIFYPSKNELLDGNNNDIIQNADGTTTFKIDLRKGYSAMKGFFKDGIRLKMFIETIPDDRHRVNYDRFGSLEFISCIAVK
jgi:endoglucanase